MKSRLLSSITILAVSGLLLSSHALAHKNHGNRDVFTGPPSAEEKLARISEALDLSNEQAVQMLVVFQDKESKSRALHEETLLLMGPEICALRSETEEDILSILTPEQAELFLQQKVDRQSAAGEKRKGKSKGHIDCSQFEDSQG